MQRLVDALKKHQWEIGVGVVTTAAAGYVLWRLLNPPRAFKDVDIDDVPEQLRDIAEAIYEAGAEDLFFQVEAATLNSNFKRFAQTSPSGELVLTEDGFVELMRSLGVPDAALLRRIFASWDRNDNGEISFTEFLQAIALCMKGTTAQKVNTLFHIMDLDGDGVVTRAEMTKFYVNMYSLTKHPHHLLDIEKQVEDLFSKTDKDFSGGLTLTEFTELCSLSKFVTGETITTYLDDITRLFAQTLGENRRTLEASDAPTSAAKDKGVPTRSKSAMPPSRK